VLFFSGHGDEDPYRTGEFYFLTHDSNPLRLRPTAVNMTGLEFLRRVEAQRVILITDACRGAGLARDGTRSTMGSMNNLFRALEGSSGKAIMTSSRFDEWSLEKPELQNGIFTHYLLRGLRGEADKKGNGVVTLFDLYDYLSQRVPDESAGRQHPQLEARGVQGPFPISVMREAAISPAPEYVPAKPIRRFATLVLKTSPPGAKVQIGERDIGQSADDGLLIVKDVEVGITHRIKARKDGFIERSEPITSPDSYEGEVFKHQEIRLEQISRWSPPERVLPLPEAVPEVIEGGF